MGRYISKPQEVEAIQWTGDNWMAVHAWVKKQMEDGCAKVSVQRVRDDTLILSTMMLTAEVRLADWLICNETGVVFMANDDAFQERYEFLDEVLDPEGGTHERPLN